MRNVPVKPAQVGSNAGLGVNAARLDDKGRCCGRKPMHYRGGGWRSPARPMKFCDRCCREYHPETGQQRENWKWKMQPDGTWLDTTDRTRMTDANAAAYHGGEDSGL